MSLYILPENQKIIWDTISKVPLFQKLCNETHNGEQWFQNIIQLNYNKIQHLQLDKKDLRNLNKETIQNMLQILKNKYSIQPALSQNVFNNSSSFQTNTTETRGFILEQKQNALNHHFQTRQEEYGNLLKKPSVSEIDFREKMDDDKPIDNMDELLQKQLLEREYDIQPKQTEKEGPIDIGAVEIIEKESKSVKWKDEQIDNKYEELKTTLEDFMEKMSNEIKEIRGELEQIKNVKKQETEEIKSIERMKQIMSKLRNIEDKNENIVKVMDLPESV